MRTHPLWVMELCAQELVAKLRSAIFKHVQVISGDHVGYGYYSTGGRFHLADI